MKKYINKISKKKHINLLLFEDDQEMVNEYMKNTGISLSNLLRYALRHYINSMTGKYPVSQKPYIITK